MLYSEVPMFHILSLRHKVWRHLVLVVAGRSHNHKIVWIACIDSSIVDRMCTHPSEWLCAEDLAELVHYGPVDEAFYEILSDLCERQILVSEWRVGIRGVGYYYRLSEGFRGN